MSETKKAVSFAEYHQAFHVYAYENALSSNARALFGYLVGEFNAAYWKKTELSKTVREVRAQGGFNSESTVQRAKAELGTENIIKISKHKNTDVYRLVEPAEWKKFKQSQKSLEQVWNKSGTTLEQTWNKLGTPDGLSNYAPAKDEEDREDEKTFTTTTATTRVEIKETDQLKERRRQISENSEEVKQAWFDCEGEKLKGGVALGLIGLEKTYGTKVVLDAIYRAHQANSQPRLSFNFVKAVLERTVKGGEKGSGKIVPIRAGTNNAAVVSDYAGAWDFNDEMPPDYDG